MGLGELEITHSVCDLGPGEAGPLGVLSGNLNLGLVDSLPPPVCPGVSTRELRKV